MRSLSLFLSFAGMAIMTCCKGQKIEGMCSGAGWDGTNILILSCKTLVSFGQISTCSLIKLSHFLRASNYRITSDFKCLFSLLFHSFSKFSPCGSYCKVSKRVKFYELSNLPQAEILVQDLGLLKATLSLLCAVFLRQWNNSFQVP